MEVSLRVNGNHVQVDVEPRTSLAEMLRQALGLTGTHINCEQGICGVCTVVLDGEPIRSCLMFAVQAAGSDVITVEGIGAEGRLTPLQQNLIECSGLQCGFCTPGFVTLCSAVIATDQSLTDSEIRELVGSNICRCTGYTGIIEAVKKTVNELSVAANYESRR